MHLLRLPVGVFPAALLYRTAQFTTGLITGCWQLPAAPIATRASAHAPTSSACCLPPVHSDACLKVTAPRIWSHLHVYTARSSLHPSTHGSSYFLHPSFQVKSLLWNILCPFPLPCLSSPCILRNNVLMAALALKISWRYLSFNLQDRY